MKTVEANPEEVEAGAVSGPIITEDAPKSDKSSWESNVELLVFLGKFIE